MASDKHGLFWNSVDDDRLYDADSFAEWLKKFFTSGVFKDELEVTAADGMTINVSSGYANCEGKVRFFDDSTKLTINTAGVSYPRIDTVIVDCDFIGRTIELKIVQGNYNNNNPVAIKPVRNSDNFQLVLAEIMVNAGASSISQKDITDKRPDPAVCGYVAGTVEQMDFSQFTAQWEDYISNFKKENEDSYSEWENSRKEIVQNFEDSSEASFNAWFAGIQQQLDGNADARLTELTNEHESRLALLEKMVIKNDINCPIQLETSEEGNPVLLVDADGKAILAVNQYEERK